MRSAYLVLLIVAPYAVAQPAHVTVIKMTVTPATEPRPVLKYELLPSLRERTPGNAAVGYFRAFATLPTPSSGESARTSEANIAKWKDTPLDKLPVADVRKHLQAYHTALRELDRATRSERCDWEMIPRIKAEDIGVVVDEISPCREVVRYLALRVRAELAGDQFDDAAKSLRTAFQVSEHVGEAPTLIHLLVGLAVETVALEQVDEWVGRPGSPNLYWALSGLPRPLIDPRPALQGEAMFSEALFPRLRELEGGPLSREVANQIAEELLMRTRGLTAHPESPHPAAEQLLAKIGMTGYVALQYPTAKAELVARGRPSTEVEAYPATQAVLLNSVERFREMRDDQWRWLGMPYPDSLPAIRRGEEKRKKSLADAKTDMIMNLLALLLPSTEKVFFAMARVERKVAALRTLEAVRMHAALHRGAPPASLADVTVVPIPDDPITGRPFGYAPRDAGFTLTAPPPAGESPNPSNTLNYDVTIRTK